MTDPIGYDEFQGEPDLPHYPMVKMAFEVPGSAFPDQWEPLIILRVLIDGPQRLVAIWNLDAEEVFNLQEELQKALNLAKERWGDDWV